MVVSAKQTLIKMKPHWEQAMCGFVFMSVITEAQRSKDKGIGSFSCTHIIFRIIYSGKVSREALLDLVYHEQNQKSRVACSARCSWPLCRSEIFHCNLAGEHVK